MGRCGSPLLTASVAVRGSTRYSPDAPINAAHVRKLMARVKAAQRRRRREALTRATASAELILERRAPDDRRRSSSRRHGTRIHRGLSDRMSLTELETAAEVVLSVDCSECIGGSRNQFIGKTAQKHH